MKTKNYLQLTFLLLFLTSNAFIGKSQIWTALNSGTTNLFNATFFLNADVGYVAGSDIMKTIDGGVNWTIQSPMTTSYYSSIYFTNSNIGYAVQSSGEITKTFDGAASWSNLYTVPSADLNCIVFPSQNTGYVVGYNTSSSKGIICKTTNGGTSWSNLSPPSNQIKELNHACFISNDTGFICGALGVILVTTNGGSSWIQHNQAIDYTFNAIHFVNSHFGYVTGTNNNTGNGVIFISHDGGTTWADCSPSNPVLPLNDIWFINSTTGYAIGQHCLILKTTNSGANWTRHFTTLSDTTNDLNAIAGISPGTYYAVGTSGTILKNIESGIGINESAHNSDFISVFPNPATSVIQIKDLPENSVVKYQVLDQFGQVYENGTLNTKSSSINIEHLSAGTYFIRLTNDTFTKTLKFIRL